MKEMGNKMEARGFLTGKGRMRRKSRMRSRRRMTMIYNDGRE